MSMNLFCVEPENDYYENELIAYSIDPSTICQCSGLKDKNNILFFEGDKYIGADGNLYCISDIHEFCCFEDAENCEIIGNIHDN